jgi:hypothetical protein
MRVGAGAQSAGFTVTGNPEDHAAETVRVDPVALTGEGASRITIDYASDPQLVRFRDMAPNSTQRIVRAAQFEVGLSPSRSNTTSHTPCPSLRPRFSNLVSGRYSGLGA